MNKIKLNVSGMVCEGCENRIKNALKLIDGVEEVYASHKENTVKVELSKELNVKEIIDKIEDLGFEVIKEE